MVSKFSAAIAATVLMGALGPVSAATVQLQSNDTQLITLHDVSGADLSFALSTAGRGYSNYGGYIKWSTRLDGRQDWDGPYSTCYECGYDGGAWALAFNPWDATGSQTQTDVALDFGGVLDTVYVWVRATYGAGSLSVAEANAGSDIPAVPLPAAGILLVSALGVGAGVLMRRRKTA